MSRSTRERKYGTVEGRQVEGRWARDGRKKADQSNEDRPRDWMLEWRSTTTVYESEREGEKDAGRLVKWRVSSILLASDRFSLASGLERCGGHDNPATVLDFLSSWHVLAAQIDVIDQRPV